MVPVLGFPTLTAIAALFQLALALGAPWGAYTLGGRFKGKLPPRMRLVAVLQIVLLLVFALIVPARAGLGLGQLYPASRVAIWFVAAFFALGSLANLATLSKGERLIWGPANVLMLIASIMVALS